MNPTSDTVAACDCRNIIYMLIVCQLLMVKHKLEKENKQFVKGIHYKEFKMHGREVLKVSRPICMRNVCLYNFAFGDEVSQTLNFIQC
jgi:hypothetical protein